MKRVCSGLNITKLDGATNNLRRANDDKSWLYILPMINGRTAVPEHDHRSSEKDHRIVTIERNTIAPVHW
ncbi:jg11616 [Pararge aegeria aegeria]|uniref:Jg11616 protein n=1 Tax=Pararge aegeria aegeria TaxID=348720 RepID=A0A8S4S4Z3_9NEOP|nr:jg11616 [Pararge aegeria aegeria]